MRELSKYHRLLVLVAWAALACVIILLTSQGDPSAGIDEINRNIETPSKLILNGYLGALTDQRAVGSLPLLLPFLIIVLVYRKELPSFWLGIIIFLFLALFLIGYNGYHNDRYQYSTLASILFVVFILSARLFKENYKNYVVHFLLVFTVLNSGIQIATHLWPKYSNRVESLKEHSGATGISEAELFSGDVFDYINLNLNGERFLVNNVPEFYVYTSEFGVFYWAGNDQVYLSGGPDWFFRGRDRRQIVNFVSDELNTKYVVTSTALSKYDERFEELLLSEAELIYQDGMENQIYKIIE